MTEPSGPTPLTVVFVSYHSEALVAGRAAALLAAGLEVVVADNSGTYDGPGAVVDPGGNVGFGAGVNAAVASLPPGPGTVVLHNPDLDADPDTLRALATRLAAQPRPGALAPAVLEPGRLRTAGFRWPQLRREAPLALLEATGLQARRRRRPRARAASDVEPSPEATFGSGALLALDLGAFRSVGGFDDRWFLYLEDADLWRRLRDAGRTVGFAPDLVVHHASAEGSPMADLDRAALRWVGIELFAAVHGRRGAWVLHRLVHLVGAAIAALRGGRVARVVLGRWLRLAGPAAVAEEVRRRHRARAAR